MASHDATLRGWEWSNTHQISFKFHINNRSDAIPRISCGSNDKHSCPYGICKLMRCNCCKESIIPRVCIKLFERNVPLQQNFYIFSATDYCICIFWLWPEQYCMLLCQLAAFDRLPPINGAIKVSERLPWLLGHADHEVITLQRAQAGREMLPYNISKNMHPIFHRCHLLISLHLFMEFCYLFTHIRNHFKPSVPIKLFTKTWVKSVVT